MYMRDEIEQALKLATVDPCTFFAGDADGILKRWKIATHPDKWPGDEEQAKTWFTQFTELAGQAANPRKIDKYRIKRKLCDGDLCEVLIGVHDGVDVLIKNPVAKAAPLMKAEMDNLKVVRAKANEKARYLFPIPVESLGQVNVFAYADDLESVASVMRRYPDGISGRHIGWLFKRILLALSWSHGAKIVHGAVTPEHVLVCKRNHGIVLCDWIHSGAPGSAIKLVPKKYKHTYPDSAVRDKKLCPELDIAMAAGVVEGLMDKDCPKRIRSFIHSLRQPASIHGETAWDFHEQFDVVLRQVYGAPKWVDLI
jgi:serine/threonine protein kinase